MARDLSAEEAKAEHVAAMGDALGKVYDALWQQLANAFNAWNEFVELYGVSQDRIDLLNAAAGHFFRIVQDLLWEGTLLALTKLTDPAEMGGKSNLTVQRLLNLVDPKLRVELNPLVDEAVKATAFARDWRNRHITHSDLALALRDEAKPLSLATRRHVDQALDSLAEVLNCVSRFYRDGSTTMFRGVGPGPHGAVSLLYVIRDGLNADAAMRKRLTDGNPLPDDFTSQPDV